ncbi:hypothetical protein A2Z56_02370 [Candidatus Kaiserbacteria bacterium RIFCSPHIGHO2_12_45_16]|nr:MAG: hypothetical protein A2Z56_02370 [Candidatus Kaiserbacteria bacterium RIFCSPHIGHO2_12_45_16]
MPPKKDDRSGRGTTESPFTETQINDLSAQGIREGDMIPGAGILTPTGTVDRIQVGSPVISSEDRVGEYNSLSSDITDRETPTEDIPDTGLNEKKDTPTGSDTTTTTTTTSDGSGDAVYDAYLKNREDETKKEQQWYDEEKKKIDRLLPKTLAAIDATYKSTVTNIESTYEKLLDSQVKINQVDLGRVKAYGVQNLGGYVPLEFTKGISKQEQSNANEISKLENERTSLIAKAKAARQEGRVGAMRDSVEDLRKVEEQMRERVDFLLKEVQTRFEITEKAREEKETKRLEAVDKALKRAALTYMDDFEEAKTPEDMDKIVKKIIRDSGGMFTDTDYYDIYSSIQTSISEKRDAALKTKKTETEIANIENQMYNRNRTEDRLQAGGGDDEDNAWAEFNSVFESANDDGNPVIGDDGYANPEIFAESLAVAKQKGISRKDFIAEYGYLINTDSERIKDYKLTQAEINALRGL